MNVGFMVGNPVAYSSSNNIDQLTDAYTKVDIVSHDTELEKDLSVFGIGYELVYLKQDTKTNKTYPDIKCIDPRGIFLVTDDTIDASFNDGIERRKQARSDKSDYLAKNDILLKDFSKTGKAGAFGFNDIQQVIVLKQNPLSRAYAVRYR